MLPSPTWACFGVYRIFASLSTWFKNLLLCCILRHRFVVYTSASLLFIASSLLRSQMATQSQLLCCLSRLHVVLYNVIQSLIDKIFIRKNESDTYSLNFNVTRHLTWRWLSLVIFLLLLFSCKLNIPIKALEHRQSIRTPIGIWDLDQVKTPKEHLPYANLMVPYSSNEIDKSINERTMCY